MVRNSYHLIKNSPWPFLSSMGGLIITMGLTGWFHKLGMLIMKLGFIMIIIIMLVWWRDVIRESWLKKHTTHIQLGLRVGMVLFITSEVFFFFSFFWAYFTSSLCPTVELGCVWPPVGLDIIDPFSVPLCNTAILLWSGLSLTLSHDSLKKGWWYSSFFYLDYTCVMGILFLFFQGVEYSHTTFSIADSVYGSVFFVATGFHGLHVLVGTVFLIVCVIRMWEGHFLVKEKSIFYIIYKLKVSPMKGTFCYLSGGQMVGYEAAIWYWHFVDVVWIFLFLSIYWWGSLCVV